MGWGRFGTDHAVVVEVAHHLELVLLPAQQGHLHQHLLRGGRRQPGLDDLLKLLRVVRNAAARAAQGERRADNQRVLS